MKEKDMLIHRRTGDKKNKSKPDMTPRYLSNNFYTRSRVFSK